MKKFISLLMCVVTLGLFCGNMVVIADDSAARVDVDLSAIPSYKAFAAVDQIYMTPDAYRGKTVKMKGTFCSSYDAATGMTYYACVVRDFNQCCGAGIEFTLSNGKYPAVNSEITVVGTLDTYMENGYMYCTLKNAKLQ